MSTIEKKYNEDQLQQKIHDFKISDLYQRVEKSNKELKMELNSSCRHLDNKITGIYAIIIGFFIAWYFNGNMKQEEINLNPSNSTELKADKND